VGTALLGQIVQGQFWGDAVIAMPGPGVSTLPLSSTARLNTFKVPLNPNVA
jgi:hypothetical protein